MNASSIRKKFLEYFKKNGHEIVKSSSTIPSQDPTLLFTNAGMNQFKDIFLGAESRSYDKATTSQKCVRAGGKHNDLDQVGFTKRHLTFFEMLGNFSFGSYFKREAIRFAWNFLVGELGIDKSRLSATVHTSDDEAERIWIDEIGLSPEKVTRLGDADNFWQMGDTGPCGPCSEIFYDRGPQFDSQGADERFVEIWNMVFMQNNRSEDGKLARLASPGIDTGMGLERLVCVLEGAESVFSTSVFSAVRLAIENKTAKVYAKSDDKTKAAFNVLCDHIRSASFIIADGGRPSNEGRGYVLRKIIRRALLFAKKLSPNKDLFMSLACDLALSMGEAYPELVLATQTIEKILEEETARFFANLEKGQKIFASYITESDTISTKAISGQKCFKLYDTYGFPLEVTRIMAMDEGLSVDVDGFESCMEQQRAQSCKKKIHVDEVEIPHDVRGEFVGYDKMTVESVISWVGAPVASDRRWICAEQNPFFSARGGQVSDSGLIEACSKTFQVVEVKDVATSPSTKVVAILVQGQVDCLAKGQHVVLKVDQARRLDTAKNHSGTHLLHAALRQVLGAHATQAGSVVEPDYLRFDFNHAKPLTQDEIFKVESLVNEWIQETVESEIFQTSMDEAVARGADAIFGEKYNPEKVRVVNFPDRSIELCGGTHLKNTGQIGLFKIVSEESLGVGIRRIFALTGPKALELFQKTYSDVKEISGQFACKSDQALEAVLGLKQRFELAQKETDKLCDKVVEVQVKQLVENFKLVGEIKFVFAQFDDILTKKLKDACSLICQKLENSLVFCFSTNAAGRLSFVAEVDKNLSQSLSIKEFSAKIESFGLRSGGKGLMIQGGGSLINANQLSQAIENFLLENRVGR